MLKKILFLISALMVSYVSAQTTITVATDGSGMYNCDGIDDHVEINKALADIGAAGGTVHLKAGTYIIDDQIIIAKSNTTLEGDGEEKTIIKLVDEADWGAYLPAADCYIIDDKALIINSELANENLTLKKFTIDGNKKNQHYTHPKHGRILIEDGESNYPAIVIGTGGGDEIKNVIYSHIRVIENNDDAFVLFNGNGATVEHCYVTNSGHSSVYFMSCINVLVQYNEFVVEANSGVRFDCGNHIVVKNNLIYGEPEKTGNSNFGVQFTHRQVGSVGVDDFIIENNFIKYTAGAGICVDAYTPENAKGMIIRNNRIYQCGNVGTSENQRETGGINIKNFTNTLIENNTIVNCIGSGIRIGGNVGFNTQWPNSDTPLTATIKNNIITHMVAPKGLTAFGIDIRDNNTAVCTYNNVWNNHSGNYKGCTPGVGSISVDPMFHSVDIGTNFWNTNGNADFHLKSNEGRWDDSIWVTDSEKSKCINAGDPATTYSNEPAPNGGRVNMGAYGNTSEASKSSSGGTTSVLTEHFKSGPAFVLNKILSNSALSFVVEIEKPGSFSFQILNIQGQRLWAYNNGGEYAGTYNIDCNSANINNGTYFIMVKYNNMQIIRKFTVTK